jgi:hypothetical protein
MRSDQEPVHKAKQRPRRSMSIHFNFPVYFENWSVSLTGRLANAIFFTIRFPRWDRQMYRKFHKGKSERVLEYFSYIRVMDKKSAIQLFNKNEKTDHIKSKG